MPVPRLESYRGFIFVSLADDAPFLAEHLGRAAGYIDMFLKGSPVEQVALSAGAAKSKITAIVPCQETTLSIFVAMLLEELYSMSVSFR